MSHVYYHALRCVQRWKGTVEDYIPLHDWMDATKSCMPDARHRALRHHAEGIFEGERVFGHTITNSDGVVVGVREILELHVRDDLQVIPTVKDWLSRMRVEPWMNRGYRESSTENS